MKTRGFYLRLVRMLGFLPLRISLYRLAFLPKSATVGQPRGINNERLEYLGDAILDAIVADYLFERFPDADEGFMTKLRARIVKRKTLDSLARRLDIPVLIRKGVMPGNKSKHLHGNTLEALMGAIYVDRGYRRARKFFVKKVMDRHIDLVQLIKKDPDYKSRIIEWAQKNKIEAVFQSKEEHVSGRKTPSFVSHIHLDNEILGTGHASSKKEAEQQAAKKALGTLNGT